VVLPLVDATDVVLTSVGTRMIEPGRAAAWTAAELSPGGEEEDATPGSCTGIPVTKLPSL
jgi:hypothetical protein